MTIKELKSQKNWFCWNYKYDEKEKPTKVPISYKNTVTGTNEKYRDTWCTYDEAMTAKEKYDFDGIGFVIPEGICGIDIDKRDFEDIITKDILSLFDTYAEKSPSGKGLHILLQVDTSKIPKDYKEKYYQKNVKLDIESYIGGLTNRYFTYTGDAINDNPIIDCTEELLKFLDKYMLRKTKSTSTDITRIDTKSTTYTDTYITDDICNHIIGIIKRSKQAEKFEKLFFKGDITDYDKNDSSADLALCDILAFYCGGDFDLIDTLFCKSKLYRTKWDRTDYKSSTITKAIESCSGKFYKKTVKKIKEELCKMSKELELICMDDIEIEEVKWLWYPYIPAGKITILQGDPR